MSGEKLEGAARGVVGKGQEVFGDVTGDRGTQAEGMARQVAGRAQEAYGDVKEAAQGAAGNVGRMVEGQPVVSLLVAGVIGYVLALLTIRSSNRW